MMSPYHVQDFNCETGSLACLEQALRLGICLSGFQNVYFMEENQQLGKTERLYPSHAAAWLMADCGHKPYEFGYRIPSEDDDESRSTYYWTVCRLDQAECRGPNEIDMPFVDVTDGVKKVLELVGRIRKRQFLEKCGESGPFGGCEGSVTMGYRVHWGPVSGGMKISLCHIFLSK